MFDRLFMPMKNSGLNLGRYLRYSREEPKIIQFINQCAHLGELIFIGFLGLKNKLKKSKFVPRKRKALNNII